MKLKEFAADRVFTIEADASIDEAIETLAQHKVRHLPVVRDNAPVGMVSQGDVLRSVGGILSEERVSTSDATVDYAGPTQVEQIMSREVIASSPDDDATQAVRAMLDRGIRAIVVVSENSVTGIVTETDILRMFCGEGPAIPHSVCGSAVSEHMSKAVVSAIPEDNAFALILKMGDRLHHLPVVDNGRFLGILSDHDVWRSLAIDKIQKITDPSEHIRLTADFDARQIMRSAVETTTPNAKLGEAARQMVEHRIGSLPVIDSGTLIGMITATDILRVCAESLDA